MTESHDTPITPDGEARPHRRIKSFVMRAGRMTEGQQRGLDQGGPLYILPLADSPVDYDQVFGRSAPRTLRSASAWAIPCWKWPLPHLSRISSVWKCTARVLARCSMAC